MSCGQDCWVCSSRTSPTWAPAGVGTTRLVTFSAALSAIDVLAMAGVWYGGTDAPAVLR